MALDLSGRAVAEAVVRVYVRLTAEAVQPRREETTMSQRRVRALALVTAAAVALTVAGTQSVAEAGDRGGAGAPGARPT